MSIEVKQNGVDGIVRVEYVYPLEILTETRKGNERVLISLVDGAEWKVIYFTPGSAVLKISESIPFEGRIIIYDFEMSVPGAGNDLSVDLSLLSSVAVVLKLTFESEKVLICGGKKRRLRLSVASDLKVAQQNLCGFKYQSEEKFLWLY